MMFVSLNDVAVIAVLLMEFAKVLLQIYYKIFIKRNINFYVNKNKIKNLSPYIK